MLCEKPLALTAAEATEMVAAAKVAGVAFATKHHLRAAGSHRAIRGLIADGKIGRVLSLRIFQAVELPKHLRGWRLDNPGAGGGVIPDIKVRNADTVRFFARRRSGFCGGRNGGNRTWPRRRGFRDVGLVDAFGRYGVQP